MNGKVFVTGAAGALGGALMRHFGARATGVARRPGPWIQAALPDVGWIDSAPEAAIVHAAGASVALGEGDPAVLAAPHLAFAQALAARGWRGRLVLLSSAAVYGEPERLPVPESAPSAPLHAYAGHKLVIEKGFAEVAARAGFTLVILRLSNIYGTPLDLVRRRVAALVLDALRHGVPFVTFGDGGSLRDYLHADDFVRAVAAVVEASAAPPLLNLGAGTGTSLSELIAAAERVAGRRLEVRRAPPRPEAQACILDIGRIRSELGWTPRVSLGEGLARMWASGS